MSCVPCWMGVWFPLQSLTSRTRRFKSVTQHNDSLLFSWKFSFSQPPIAIPGSR
nr:MAG TPA: hypothetical protein [Caudoviricetes sp.]DAU19863.1 MAG TPA: hypothetical protein [Caudoviricetes sp.]